MEAESRSALAQLVLDGFDAFGRGDWESIMPVLSPDCKWEENQAGGFPGLDRLYRGHDGLRKWMRDTREAWEAIRSEAEDIIEVETAEDPSFVVFTRLRGRGRQDIRVDMLLYNVLWSHAGKAIRRRIYFDREEALAQAALTDREIEAADVRSSAKQPAGQPPDA